ncbi:MAG: CUB domain-containing protein [Flavobacteriales bacterium]|nr:CUB domain-containing protein [Flavobacteriales bacterium]
MRILADGLKRSGIVFILLAACAFRAEAQCTGTGMGATVALANGAWTPNSVPPNMTVTLTMTTTSGSTAATVASCNPALVGATISGPNVPGGTTITATACATVTLSQAATVTGSAAHTFIMGPYPLNYPPANAGLPSTTYCSVCPSTFTAPVCANQYFNIQACAGNLYTISLCGSASNADFSLSLTTTGFAAVAPGYYGQAFDNDGCGFAGGPSTLQFSPQTSGIYRFRVFQNACVVNASLCGTVTVQCAVPPPPPNDSPCSATALPVPILCNYQLTNVLWGTTTAGYPNPSCGAYAGRDVWYTAVVPASGNLQVQATLVSASSIGIAAYTTPACNAASASWSQLACSGTNPLVLALSGLAAPGSTVYIRVWPQGNISNQGTFNICAFEPTPPFNDLPCGAFTLTTPTTCSPTSYNTDFAGNTTPPGLTVGAPSCGTPVNNDVWFEVVVPPSGAFTINTFAESITDMSMAWYRLSVGGQLCNPPGFAGTMTLIACNDDQFAPTNNMPRINSQTTLPAIAPALVPGETIYIRVWPEGATLNGTFSICATENVPPPNDDPCGAIPLNTSLTCNLVPTTNEGAGVTAGVAAPACGLPIQNDVWYSVVVPPNGQLEINTQGVGMTDAALALYQTSGGCAPANLSLVPPTNCQVGGSSFGASMPQQLFGGLAPGSTVYVRVWRQTGNVGPFNICARQTAAAPITGCDLNTSDSGGPTGNYSNNEVFEQTFCPVNPGDVVAIDFMAFNTQANSDFLTIYNGPTIGSPVLGVFSGGALPPGFVSSHPGGCLTIRFTSNASIVAPGFQISVSCGPPLPPQPAPSGICGTTTYDSGGANGVYANNEVITQTFCPTLPGEVVTMTFNMFSVEQNFDFLTVFNGPTTASPILGGPYTGTVNPGTFTSTDPSGCLTIRFTSDFSIVGAGWAATLRCGLPQPPPPPPPPPSGICGSTVYDPGGPGGSFTTGAPLPGNYSNATNQNPNNFGGYNCWPYTCLGGGATVPPGQPLWSQTYCPVIAGDAVTLTFISLNMEFGWDNVYIYNGPVVSPNNANGTQFLSGNGLPTCGGPAGWCNQTLGAGGFTGTANPGSFTSTHPSGCLTIAMTSDDIYNSAGWEATISCQSGFNPSAQCIYALRMYDAFGDGWAGSTITVVINGGTPSYYTVQSGSFDQVLISANNGDNISITYSGLGYFAGDNSWTFDLVGAQYPQYNSAIPAVSGNYTFTVNCSTPPRPTAGLPWRDRAVQWQCGGHAIEQHRQRGRPHLHQRRLLEHLRRARQVVHLHCGHHRQHGLHHRSHWCHGHQLRCLGSVHEPIVARNHLRSVGGAHPLLVRFRSQHLRCYGQLQYGHGIARLFGSTVQPARHGHLAADWRQWMGTWHQPGRRRCVSALCEQRHEQQHGRDDQLDRYRRGGLRDPAGGAPELRCRSCPVARRCKVDHRFRAEQRLVQCPAFRRWHLVLHHRSRERGRPQQLCGGLPVQGPLAAPRLELLPPGAGGREQQHGTLAHGAGLLQGRWRTARVSEPGQGRTERDRRTSEQRLLRLAGARCLRPDRAEGRKSVRSRHTAFGAGSSWPRSRCLPAVLASSWSRVRQSTLREAVGALILVGTPVPTVPSWR